MVPSVIAPDGSPYGVRTTSRRVTSRFASCVSPLPPMIASIATPASAALQRVDRWQVSPRAVHIHAETEHVAVRNGNADEIGLDGPRAAGIFLREHRGIELGRTRLHKLLAHGRERMAFIQN